MNEKQQLVNLIQSHEFDQKLLTRATIILKMIDGMSKKQIAEELNITRPTVYLWINRYKKSGINGLLINRYIKGLKSKISQKRENAIVGAVPNTIPDNSAKWSIRSIAKAQNVTSSAVHEIWGKYGLNHRQKNSLEPQNFIKVNQTKHTYNNEMENLSDLKSIGKNLIHRRTDRTARLVQMQVLLFQFPNGLTMNEIARKCSVHPRTAYRDIKILESKLGVPIWENGNKRGIVKGYFIPPIHFTQTETINIFLALRLMQNYSHIYDASISSTFLKLITAVPSILQNHIANILNYIDTLPRDDRKKRNFDRLITAWLSQHKVIIQYQEASDNTSDICEYLIEPYFIEPSLLGYSNHLIGYNHTKKKISSLKFDRIKGDVIISPDTYKTPTDFNIINYISSPWEIYINKKLITAKLHFIPHVSKIATATIWHPSQKMEFKADGSAIITLKVYNTRYFHSWILSWGHAVEVIEPKELRNYIRKTAYSIFKIYKDKNYK